MVRYMIKILKGNKPRRKSNSEWLPWYNTNYAKQDATIIILSASSLLLANFIKQKNLKKRVIQFLNCSKIEKIELFDSLAFLQFKKSSYSFIRLFEIIKIDFFVRFFVRKKKSKSSTLPDTSGTISLTTGRLAGRS